MIRGNQREFILILSMATLSVIIANKALPQESKVGADEQLQEIVVTAEKRVSTVQDTPISLTAVSGADIQSRGYADFTSLAQSIPGISMRTSGPGETEFEMRGMVSSGGDSSTVGFYLDEIPLNAPTNAYNGKVVIDPNLYDLSRVEVLRGPQGTLYGSGSMGGTIKIIPNAPDPSGYAASTQTIFSHTDGGDKMNQAVNAMVNLPFGDGTAALRIVGSESHDSGWIDRIVIANGQYPLETNNLATRGNVLAAPVAANYKDVNDTDEYGVRVALLWKPTDRLSIEPSGFYQKITQDGLGDIDSNPGTNAHYQPFNTPEPYDDEFAVGSLKAQYHFDSFDLVSVTSRWTRQGKVYQDGSEQWQWALSLPTFYASQGGLGANSPAQVESDTSKQLSQEVRLTSSGDSAFQWLVGGFYGDFRSQTDLDIYFPQATITDGAFLYQQYQPSKLRQTAEFGEISYQLIPQLKATLGGRRFNYSSATVTDEAGYVAPSGTDAYTVSNTGERDQGVNPKFDLSSELSKNLLLYLTIEKGFRPGGGNQPIPTSGVIGSVCEQNLMESHATTSFVEAPLAFKPDNVWSYEIGEKTKLLDGRLTVNSGMYFEKWSAVQQYVTLPCGYVYSDNTGLVHVYGTETEINAIVFPDLTLSLNAGYTHARFVVGSLETGVTEGSRVQAVPDLTSSASIIYRHNISEDLAFTGRIENNFVGSRTDTTFYVNNLPSYDLTNLRAGLASDRWSALLFAKNVFNKRALLSDTLQIGVNVPTYNRISVGQPLTFGVDFSYRFKL